MSKPNEYKPFNGLEWATRPDIVDWLADQAGSDQEAEQSVDLSGLRPVRSEERVVEVTSRRGKYTFTTTTTTRIISNRPINTNHNTGETQS